jgi:hypothetical protein
MQSIREKKDMKITSWRVSVVSVLSALALQACGGGSSDEASVKTAATMSKTVSAGTPAALSIASGGVVSITNSTAQVTLPANGLVNATTGVAATGEVTVTLTPIDPAQDPTEMAGGHYEARNPNTGATELIESFGAITVTLSQGGTALQLAKGQKATIRIPLSTRSTAKPDATIPLYYWDETNAIWLQEGTATLQGNASTGFYYEGQVSHFTTWNADKPIDQSVKITGCVDATPGNPASSSSYDVISDGMDYSGMAWATKTGGQFTVLAKKGGLVDIYVTDLTGQQHLIQTLTADTDVKLPSCFALSQTSGGTASAFQILLDHINGIVDLAYDTVEPVDVDFAQMLAPSAVCQSGKVDSLTLNGLTVAGGEPLDPGKPYTVATTFMQCVPSNAATQQQVVNGQASAAFTYTSTGTNTSLSAELTNTLTQLSDLSVMLRTSGSYGVSFQAGANGTQVTLTPKSGTQLTRLLSATTDGNTLSFKGGSLTATTALDANGQPKLPALTYNKLSYTLNGATYILNGSMAQGQGKVTLSKNGTEAAVLTLDANGLSATGTVDPF